MELKVWVEGIQRIVCGVNETTTCQDVVFALAHATGKVGRFTLVERWRNNERLLAPQEYPLKILMKWGEYSNDIQFILRQSDAAKNSAAAKPPANTSQSTPPASSSETPQGSPARSGTATVGPGGSPSGNPVGVVKGVPQTRPTADVEHPAKDIPPYREPPPPYRSPPPPTVHRKSPAPLAPRPPSLQDGTGSPEAVSYNNQYRDLVTLVNYQREKLSNQQADLIKYDAEIGFWENKGRQQERQVELLQQQICSADNQLHISTDQVQALTYIEEESELVKQTEHTLHSEAVLYRSKLADCESELQQVRARIRRLMDEVTARRQREARSAMERTMLAEMESLQSQIQHAKHATELNHLTAENLKREVVMLESAIMEKKRQVEQLVQEMKEANLQSLAGSTDELRHLLDGSCKAGSTRRIIGSPRQLENAAPTNKNPHGVWV